MHGLHLLDAISHIWECQDPSDLSHLDDIDEAVIDSKLLLILNPWSQGRQWQLRQQSDLWSL